MTQQGYLSADLATGELALFGMNLPSLSTRMDDRLVFHLPAGMSSAPIGFLFAVDGTNSTNWSGSLTINNSTFGGFMILSHNGILSENFSDGWLWPGNNGLGVPPPPSFAFSLFHEVTVTDGDFVVVDFGLSGQFLVGGALDASNTGAVSLLLPDGVTFTSDSGVFLSQRENGPNPVPEPGAATLLLAGLGGAFAMRTKRRRRGGIASALVCCAMAAASLHAQTFSVDSTRNFSGTGIVAMGGEVYQIEASGTVDLAVPDTYKTDPNGTIVTAPAAGSGAYQFFTASAVPTGQPPVVGGRKLVVREHWLAYGPFGALVAGYNPPLDQLAQMGYPETFRVVDGSGTPPPRPPSGGDFFLGINQAATGFPVQGSYNFVVTLDNGGTINTLIAPGTFHVIPASQGVVRSVTAPQGLVDSAPNAGRYVTRPDGVIQTAPTSGSPAFAYFLSNTAPVGVAPVAGQSKRIIPNHHRQMVPYGALVAGWSQTASPTSYGDFPLGFEFVGKSGTITAPPGGGFLFFGVNDFFIRGSSDNAGAYNVTVTQIDDVPMVSAAIQLSGFGGGAAITSGGFVEIYGVNLSEETRSWSGDDFIDGVAPTALGDVKVLIDGKAAFLYFVSPGQINCIAPDGLTAGEVEIVVMKGEAMSAAFPVPTAERAPALLAPPAFLSGEQQLAVGILQDGAYAGPADLIAGAAFRPATAGDRAVFYGIGFGQGDPVVPVGSIVAGATSLPNVEVMLGDVPAVVDYAGFTPGNVGLYQLNIVIPAGVTGLVRLKVTIDGVAMEQELWILVE